LGTASAVGGDDDQTGGEKQSLYLHVSHFFIFIYWICPAVLVAVALATVSAEAGSKAMSDARLLTKSVRRNVFRRLYFLQ